MYIYDNDNNNNNNNSHDIYYCFDTYLCDSNKNDKCYGIEDNYNVITNRNEAMNFNV
jgi:hypothetical protein